MDHNNTVLLKEAQFARMANYIHTLNKKLDHPSETCLLEVKLEIHSVTFNACSALTDKKFCV